MKCILVLMIILLLLFCKFLKQEWSSPASINALWNSFFVFFAVIFFGENIRWKYGGIVWIVLSCFCFLIGQFLGIRILQSGVKSGREAEYKVTNLIPVVMVVLIVICMLNPVIYLKNFGYSISSIFNLNTLLSVNETIAADRYSGEGFESGIVVMIGAVSYCISLCGGYMFDNCRSYISKICMIATVLPTIALTIVTNAKLGTVTVAFFWATGWLISFLVRNGHGINLTKKIVMSIVGIGCVVFIILYLSMMLRIGSLDIETKSIVDTKMQEYAFGQIQAFSEWFAQLDVFSYDLGSNTFMVLARYLGNFERQQGVYEVLPNITTNIFTQNRGIIEDYGIVGGLIFWIYYGLIAGWCYKGVQICRHKKKIYIVVLAMIYFSVFYGFMISPWVYTTNLIAVIGFGIFIYIIEKIKISIVIKEY